MAVFTFNVQPQLIVFNVPPLLIHKIDLYDPLVVQYILHMQYINKEFQTKSALNRDLRGKIHDAGMLLPSARAYPRFR